MLKLLQLMLVLALLGGSRGAKILAIPFFNTSMTMMENAIANRLVARNHSVTWLWPQGFSKDKSLDNDQYKIIEYPIDGLTFSNIIQELEDQLQHSIPSEEHSSVVQALTQLTKMRSLWSKFFLMGQNMCRSILTNAALMERLREEHFDSVLLIDFFVARCVHLIPQKVLKVPYASLGESISPFDMRIPALPVNFIGQEVTSPTLSDRLTGLMLLLLRNVFNVLLPQTMPADLVALVNETELDENTIAQRSPLFFYFHDELLTGYVLPKLPHMEFIGSLTAVPPKPIKDAKITNWVQKATDGFVICSFGSHIAAVKPAQLEKLFEAFEKLELPVIMRLKVSTIPSNITIPKNVLILEWLQQNDLLGHPKARLFVSHAGTNGIGESLFHGVPILAIPFVAIQHLIADRIAAQGFGLKASLDDMASSELEARARELLSNPVFRERTQRVSRLMRARPNPADVAADAMEQLMAFGGAHLRPNAAYALNFMQFYQLDIVFTFFTLLLALFLLSSNCAYKFCLCLLHLIFGPKDLRKKHKYE